MVARECCPQTMERLRNSNERVVSITWFHHTMWTHPLMPQGAIWHIYSPADAPKIRALLAKVWLVSFVTIVTNTVISGMWGELPWLPPAPRHWPNSWSMFLLNYWPKEEVARGIWSARLYYSSVCGRCHFYPSWCPPSGMCTCVLECRSHDPYCSVGS